MKKEEKRSIKIIGTHPSLIKGQDYLVAKRVATAMVNSGMAQWTNDVPVKTVKTETKEETPKAKVTEVKKPEPMTTKSAEKEKSKAKK